MSIYRAAPVELSLSFISQRGAYLKRRCAGNLQRDIFVVVKCRPAEGERVRP